MGPWRVFQLEGSQFRVKEVSKASGSGGERVVSHEAARAGDIACRAPGDGWAQNLICRGATDFCHSVLCQLGKYASSGRPARVGGATRHVHP